MRIIRTAVSKKLTCAVAVLAITTATISHLVAEDQKSVPEAKKLMQDGNYKEALAAFRASTLNEGTDSKQLIEAFSGAVQCYHQLNEVHKIDSYREAVAKQHDEDWRVLAAVAESYRNVEHYGYLIAGEFRRGHHRGGGQWSNATERDRVRQLQLYGETLNLLRSGDKPEDKESLQDVANFLQHYANAMQQGRGWRMQLLTDLSELPDYDKSNSSHGNNSGAPVVANGNPIYYQEPANWDASANDGERWRWLLAERVRWMPSTAPSVLLERARFLQSQFGVQTMASYSWFGRQQDADAMKGTYALHTLKENETIAQLATGVKRFELPDEHNHIVLFRQVMKLDEEHRAGNYQSAAAQLASVFSNRRQFPTAAEFLKVLADQAKPQPNNHYRQQYEQIVKPWGRLGYTVTQPAGRGATLQYRFRNGEQVEFTARKVKVQELLADVKAHLKSNPNKLDWQQVQIANLGYRIVEKGQEKYLGEEVARWSVDLEPRDNHFDRLEKISTPLQKAGAYFITAKLKDGNEHRVIVWLTDTAIVKKPLEGKALYYVADSVTGKPLPKCNVEFFGYWNKHIENNRHEVLTKQFAEFTDDNGFVELPVQEESNQYQWIATATDQAGRFAFLGYSGVWSANYHDQQYKQVKVLSVTDRPVYRPGHKVQYKFWVRNAQYDKANFDKQSEGGKANGVAEPSRFANQSFQIEIRNPKGEKVHTTTVTADAYGGLTGEWTLPDDATLGRYNLMVVHHGGGNFRVEEYKKPEYQVTIDAPDEPISLGDKVTATVSAKYYFGSPVTEANVKLKVTRSDYNQQWYPPSPWDWLYGSGYWWFTPDYHWYPGWSRWGCGRPWPWWVWRQPTPPEVVLEREAEIGEDGTIEVEIDTALAKEFHSDTDHRYEITAEVVDQSRRTVVATGKVLVARKPFQVFLWAHRGFYRSGDTIEVSAAARTLDGKPVPGEGKLRLLKIAYEDGKPVENEVATWDLAANEQGLANLQITAAEPGQYRLAYQLTDAEGSSIEGAQVLTIRGDNFDGGDFQFNDIEIVANQKKYAPGDKVELQISTNQSGAAVLLFLRPSNGVYLPPKLVKLKGKSTVVTFPVSAKDMPNFFVEAVTVHHGRMHETVREIYVPPADRILKVEVVPSATSYLPGQKATVQLKLTDTDGNAFIGSTVLTVYDKSLEYISGGSNVPEIKEFFWKWRRNHNPRSETNLARHEAPLVKHNEIHMNNLGVFGESVIDLVTSTAQGEGRGGGGFGGGEYGPRRLSKSMSSRSRSSGIADNAMPMSAAMPMMEGAQEESSPGQFGDKRDDSGSGAPEYVEPTVRENFADTAFWSGALETNSDGLAEVEFDMPENLTAWKIAVWGMGHGTRVGQASTDVVTRKNLIIRLQAPRFFVEKDEVVLSANVHNYLKTSKQVRVKLELEGNVLEGPEQLETTIEVPADGEQRVDWRVKVTGEGTAVVRMSALTDEESDAMQMSFPAYVHGMLKMVAFTNVIKPNENKGQFTFTVPAERRPEQTRFELRYTPTLAGAMIDALPYLADYPHGCTEQTLNRFLPTVLTQQTLIRMGVDLADIEKKRTNLNAQEIGDDVERAQDWKHLDRNPVFDDAELTKMVKAGVNKLTAMQLSDGGWGWFSGWGEHSSPHTTATVVRGLLVAQKNDVAIVPGVIDRGVDWLLRYQKNELEQLDNWDREKDAKRDKSKAAKRRADNLDALVYLVLAEADRNEKATKSNKMRDYLYTDRTDLAVYSLATYGLALEMQDEDEKLAMVMRNLSQYVKQDDENQTAWLDISGGYWWYWYGSEYEAQAYYLKLLVAENPKSEVTPRLVKYLLNNRKHATYWNSTRDTALVVEAFADYLAATGEGRSEIELEVWFDGEQKKTVTINSDNLFTFDNKLVLEGAELETGKHTVELRKQGEGPIYFNGYLTNFTLEDPIAAAGLEVKVQRNYFKLVPVEKEIDVAGNRGQAVSQRVEKYEREPIVNLQELTSGDLVEVELIVDSKNDYEYILLEDRKPAGCEAVEVRSGYNGNALGAYVEYRDERVNLFVRRLARGKHSVSYRLRAEIPGKFSALPTEVSAMYAPELKANSDEFKLRIKD
ncbi:alpha-2-macroglobulin family protein [Adhaeretor mobilis]|uniref:MG2 domain protein n=1 Tax=Adhaeretor mobilis TaxID=1930276 RepID=A0A517MVT3_9BACT|nr:MG2 domain-containing protein [Adhaeretor mobilis]QDS98988.1 MG2 domain protein [Adhaeretor mobilis]